MDIQVSCDRCGQRFVVDASGGGMEVQCPVCTKNLTAPLKQPAAANTVLPSVSTDRPKGARVFGSINIGLGFAILLVFLFGGRVLHFRLDIVLIVVIVLMGILPILSGFGLANFHWWGRWLSIIWALLIIVRGFWQTMLFTKIPFDMQIFRPFVSDALSEALRRANPNEFTLGFLSSVFVGVGYALCLIIYLNRREVKVCFKRR
jgi:hypothetical protein